MARQPRHIRPSLQPGVSTNPIEQVCSDNLAGIFPGVSGTVSKEVVDEANAFFQRIYNQPPNDIGVNEVLKLLKKFQTSGVPREMDVFNCMIKNLFEEYNFLPQYPDRELHITAQLFGGIIEHNLVTMVPLGLALRFVLEALRKATESNMFYFGVAALDQFKFRLKEFPQYCQYVQAIQHFKDFPAHLVLWVEAGALSSEPPSKPTAPVLLPLHCPRSQSPQRALSRSLLAAEGSPRRSKSLPPVLPKVAPPKHLRTPPAQPSSPLSRNRREDRHRSDQSVEREKLGETERKVGGGRKEEGREYPTIPAEEVDMNKSNTMTGEEGI